MQPINKILPSGELIEHGKNGQKYFVACWTPEINGERENRWLLEFSFKAAALAEYDRWN